MKKKSALYAIGLVMALITLLPPLPKAVKILIALIPLLFFGLEMLFGYLTRVVDKNFINEYLSALLGTIAIACSGRFTYAAVAIICCSAAITFFKSNYNKTMQLFDAACAIVPKKAVLLTKEGSRVVKTSELTPGQTVVVKTGDIVPCDGMVTNGSAMLDYTNIFGPCQPIERVTGSRCFSGGIVQSGKIAVQCQRTGQNSLAGTMEQYLAKAHEDSKLLKKMYKISKIFEPAVMLLSVAMLIALVIATKDFAYSVNIAAVIMFASPVVGLVKVLPMLYHTSLVGGRKRGAIFSGTDALERFSKIQTLTINEMVSKETLAKIEETGIIPARNGSHALDAVLYRSKEALEADRTDAFKISLGFFSDKADMTIFDGNIERVAGAVRISKNFKNILFENLACLVIEKLALIALVFLLNLTPAIAIAAEFAAWMICMFNASRITNILTFKK